MNYIIEALTTYSRSDMVRVGQRLPFVPFVFGEGQEQFKGLVSMQAVAKGDFANAAVVISQLPSPEKIIFVTIKLGNSLNEDQNNPKRDLEEDGGVVQEHPRL